MTTNAEYGCEAELCNEGWTEVLTNMSPYGWANWGIALGLGFAFSILYLVNLFLSLYLSPNQVFLLLELPGGYG